MLETYELREKHIPALQAVVTVTILATGHTVSVRVSRDKADKVLALISQPQTRLPQ